MVLGNSDSSSISLDKNQGQIKNPYYNHFQPFFNQSSFIDEGKSWKEKRKAVVHGCFKGVDLDRVLKPLIVKCLGVEVLEVLERERVEEGEGGGWQKVDDVVPCLQRMSLGVIFEFLTGVGLNGKRNGEDFEVKQSSSDDNNSGSPNIPTKPEISNYLSSVLKMRLITLAHSRSLFYHLLPSSIYTLISPLMKNTT